MEEREEGWESGDHHAIYCCWTEWICVLRTHFTLMFLLQLSLSLSCFSFNSHSLSLSQTIFLTPSIQFLNYKDYHLFQPFLSFITSFSLLPTKRQVCFVATISPHGWMESNEKQRERERVPNRERAKNDLRMQAKEVWEECEWKRQHVMA